MISVRVFIFITTFISIYVSCLQKKACDFDDAVCLLESEKRFYAIALNNASTGHPLAPIHLEVFETNLPSVKYTLHNASLTGILYCDIKEVRIFKEKKEFNYYIQCPRLTTEAEYEVNGIIDDVPMEGKGTFIATHDDYHLTYDGNYEREFDDNNKLHIRLIDFTLKMEIKGTVTYKYNNLFNGNTGKSDEFHQHFSKENWKTIDKILGEPVMEAFQNEFIKMNNEYLKLVPIEDIYYYYE